MNNKFNILKRGHLLPPPLMMKINTRVLITLGEIENIPGTFKGVSYNGYFVEIDNIPGINIPMEVIKLSVN